MLIKEKSKAKACDPLELADIDKIKHYFIANNQHRNYVLFVLGINLGLRVSDLIQLQIKDLYKKEYLDIVEQKTKKRRIIYLNNAIQDTVNNYVDSYLYISEDTYLFPSRKKNVCEHIKRQHVHKIFKNVAKELGIKGNIGSHSLRKTTAYQILQKNKHREDIILDISKMFNHSSTDVTKRYLISSVVIDNLYEDLNL